jgi:hypothetical protein
MSATSFEFPYRFRTSGKKTLAYPEVIVRLKTFLGASAFNFILDTGADVTTMPDYMINVLEIPSSALTKTRSFGISGVPVDSLDALVNAKIGTVTFDLPVTFITNKDVPLLLGKEGIFERFTIVLDNIKQKTVFRIL